MINGNSERELKRVIVKKNYNFSNLLLEDQINSNDGSSANGSIDPSILNAKNQIGFLDVSAGLLLYNDKAWFDASLKHLNIPNITFTDYGNVPLEIYLSLHSSYSVSLRDSPISFFQEDTNLLFTANYMKQTQYNRLDVGAA